MTLIRSELSVAESQEVFDLACQGFSADARICDLRLPTGVSAAELLMSMSVLGIERHHRQVMYPGLNRTVSDLIQRTHHRVDGEDVFIPVVDLENSQNILGPVVYGSPANYAMGFAVYRTIESIE